MTPRPLAALLAGALLLGAGPAALSSEAASPVGLWQTPEDRGQIRIFACGAKLCGRIAGSDALRRQPGLTDARNKDKALRARPLKDLQLMGDFAGGPKVWKGGWIYRPQDGSSYKGSMELLAPGKLKVTGCVAPALCGSQVWTRVN